MGESKQRVDQCVAAVRKVWDGTPKVGIILGTGLGALSEEIEAEVVVEYKDIPGMPETTLEAHAGRLVLGTLVGVPVAAVDASSLRDSLPTFVISYSSESRRHGHMTQRRLRATR